MIFQNYTVTSERKGLPNIIIVPSHNNLCFHLLQNFWKAFFISNAKYLNNSQIHTADRRFSPQLYIGARRVFQLSSSHVTHLLFLTRQNRGRRGVNLKNSIPLSKSNYRFLQSNLVFDSASSNIKKIWTRSRIKTSHWNVKFHYINNSLYFLPTPSSNPSTTFWVNFLHFNVWKFKVLARVIKYVGKKNKRSSG